jgi:hypothetical protein
VAVSSVLPGTILCAAIVCAPSVNAADGRSLVFDAYRSGVKIGTHTLRFVQEGDKLLVDISIEFKGKAFFIPFSYSHMNREVWQGQKLISLDSRTISNGKTSTLQARAEGNMLKLVINGNPGLVPQMFSTSYWNGDTLSQKRLLNSQKGDVIELKLEGKVQVRAPKTDGTFVPATEYRKTGTNKFNIAVQYDNKGCLVGMNFKAPRDVTRISYKLVARPSAVEAPDLLANSALQPCLDTAKKPA